MSGTNTQLFPVKVEQTSTFVARETPRLLMQGWSCLEGGVLESVWAPPWAHSARYGIHDAVSVQNHRDLTEILRGAAEE